ncbi:CBS-domain-containing membrane protein [Methylobacterium sp. BE186]|uniref:CBS domain-containing protein n=1 Tax=Methylobacterium sp. BE186 TaxID=2817715 RepID=UPI002860C5B8|nr:CBS domain-containing protein [Methylobacterium sp. BE186]MDR7040303.1 CBS-domain-containing membrane protein [Methylobacterium sp. BE186]
MTVLLLKRSIRTEKIARRGQHITREYGVDSHELTRVSDIMVRDVDVLDAGASIAASIQASAGGRDHAYPVVDGMRRPVGMVFRADALRWKTEKSR